MTSRSGRRRVLFIVPMPPPFAGVGQLSKDLIDSDLQTEFDLEVLDLSKRRGIRVQTFKIETYSLFFAFLVWTRLVAKLISFRPQVTYIASSYDFSYLRNVMLMLTAKLFGTKVVCHFHGRRSGPLFQPRRAIIETLLRLTAHSFDKIIFLSEGLKESLAPTFGAAKAEVIPNFVDPGNFRPPVGLTARPARLIFVGRLSDDKGIFDLIEAAALLYREGRLFFVDLLGVGETEEEEQIVHEFVDQSGVKDIVLFHGVKTDRAKADLLAAATVFVLPSKLEIFPVALLEAYASGLPVVCSSVGAIPEIVREGENGLLIEPGDPVALAHQIRRILDDEQLRQAMGSANRLAAETLYRKELAVRKLSEIIRSV
jgi:glycosyltransferase involved in cell wall biosynthesis